MRQTAAGNSVSGLETHLGYWLRFVSNHVSHAFRLKVEDRGVTVAEWVVMRALFDAAAGAGGGGVHPSRLADTIGLTRGAVSKLADRLAAKGLLSCAAGKADRRFQVVKLTPAGRRLVPALAELADQNDREFFGHLSPQQQADLAAALKEIVRRRGLKQAPVD